ncbi:pyruvate kinase [Methanosarcinales archaeon]|nr:MAG: pyruvate kinase [Methanosarcinales archaeon]
MQHTKIVCTIGPASSDRATLSQMVRSGMNVARLNFSHGTHDEHRETIELIQSVSDELGVPVAILQDIAGPKMRIGRVEGERATLNRTDRITLTIKDMVSSGELISVDHPMLATEARPGDTVLLADGSIELRVEDVSGDEIHCIVVEGGVLTSHKGVNLPGASIHAPTISEKDRDDILFGVENGVDLIAISFVRESGDLRMAREIISGAGAEIPVIAKIERHEALARIDEIITDSDGIMVARGDLGVDVPFEEIGLIQKKIIRLCNEAGKPVITATQMLRSMVEKNRPTRAEITDITNAILDGTDAIMLSEETASGRYPVRSVGVMSRIAGATEASCEFRDHVLTHRLTPSQKVSDVVSRAACDVAERLGASAILAPTESGTTPRLIARYRPAPGVIALCTSQQVYRKLCLIWGVRSVMIEPIDDTDRLLSAAERVALEQGIGVGDVIVTIAGTSTGRSGGTDLIKVAVVR